MVISRFRLNILTEKLTGYPTLPYLLPLKLYFSNRPANNTHVKGSANIYNRVQSRVPLTFSDIELSKNKCENKHDNHDNHRANHPLVYRHPVTEIVVRVVSMGSSGVG